MSKRYFRAVCLLLGALLLASLCGCGKRTEPEPEGLPAEPEEASDDGVIEVRLTAANLYDYFEYHEFLTPVKGENNGEISNVQVAYGLRLREGWTPANDKRHKDTLHITFTAEQVVNTGSFQVDFDTLQWSGTPSFTERKSVSEELIFWPKGDRTSVWTFGNFSDSAILYLENFTITSVSGSVYLKPAETEALG